MLSQITFDATEMFFNREAKRLHTTQTWLFLFKRLHQLSMMWVDKMLDQNLNTREYRLWTGRRVRSLTTCYHFTSLSW